MIRSSIAIFAAFCSLSAFSAEPKAAEPPRLEWDTTLNHFQFDADKFIGQRFVAECPAMHVRDKFEAIHGTDVYSSKSSVCVAALHAGQIDKNGGIVTVQLNPGLDAYKGSESNGVTSSELPDTQRSMVFVTDPMSPEADEIYRAYAPVLEWDSKFTATGFAHKQLIGQQFLFNCPRAPGNLRWRRVVGTDVYAFKSIVCQAAVHSGHLTTDGGYVTVRMGDGGMKLTGSIKNGIETKDGSSGIRSLSFVDTMLTN